MLDHHSLIHLFHIFIIGSFLLYIGIKQSNLSTTWFHIMIGVGVSVIGYHAYKYFILNKGQGSWISLFHMLFIAPLLIVTGYLGASAPRYLFELILMAAFAAMGYHAYYMIYQ